MYFFVFLLVKTNLLTYLLDHIDAVDWNTSTDDNNSISNNIPDSIQNNVQRIDFVVSNNILNSNTSSNENENDALPNKTLIDIDDIITEGRKNKRK